MSGERIFIATGVPMDMAARAASPASRATRASTAGTPHDSRSPSASRSSSRPPVQDTPGGWAAVSARARGPRSRPSRTRASADTVRTARIGSSNTGTFNASYGAIASSEPTITMRIGRSGWRSRAPAIASSVGFAMNSVDAT